MSKFYGSNRSSMGVPSNTFGRGDHGGLRKLNGVFVAKVVDIADERYQQHIWVDLIGSERHGNKETQEERHRYHKVRQTSPFGGTVQGSNYSNNYGATWSPPAPGTEVLVAFTGQEQEGFLLGVLPDINRNAMIGGHPSSPDPDEGEVQTAFDAPVNKTNRGERKKHPVGQAIARQGLALDSIRGHGSSGARRESPSRVSGFNSPGGHSLVLDDGTEAYKEGVNHVPDKSRAGGKNNLIRLRSGGGAQILLNDTAGIVYVINQNGTGWVEIDASGNIDVYSESNISMHAKENINFYAGDEFNVDAETINMRSRGTGGIKIESTTDQIQLFAQQDMKLTTEKTMHIKARPHMKLTADLIDLNGPPATAATKPTAGALAVNREVKESIAGRVPEAEPWEGHGQRDSKIAAQAKSNPMDPDQDDYVLGTASSSGAGSTGGIGGHTGGTSAKRTAQKESDAQTGAQIYSDYFVDQHVNRNSIEPSTAGSADELNRAVANANQRVDTAIGYDAVGTGTIDDPGRIPNADGNPRSKRPWKSDVLPDEGYDV